MDAVTVHRPQDGTGPWVFMNLPSWEHGLQGAAAKPAFIEIFFPPSTASSQRFYCLPHQNCSWNKFVPPVLHGKSFFLSSPKETPVGVFIVASNLCFGHCDAGASLASATEDIDPEQWREKGKKFFLRWRGRGVSSAHCFLLRFHCCKLHWEANLVQLHWGLDRIFSAGWQPSHICKIIS